MTNKQAIEKAKYSCTMATNIACKGYQNLLGDWVFPKHITKKIWQKIYNYNYYTHLNFFVSKWRKELDAKKPLTNEIKVVIEPVYFQYLDYWERRVPNYKQIIENLK